MRNIMKFSLLVYLLLFGVIQVIGENHSGTLKLPAILGSNMVLQQDRTLPVWGWAAPGGRVVVRIAGQEKTAVTNEKGKWQVKLDPLKAGGPFELIVQCKEKITLTNILVGEVWVCSGQSNMDFRLKFAMNSKKVVAKASCSEIRFFTMSNIAATEPREDVDGHWSVCTPGSAAWFSAVGYFFGRRLHQELKVPIGLIHTAWGGTVAEAWTSREGLESEPKLAIFLARAKNIIKNYPQEKKKYKEMAVIYSKVKTATENDGENDKGWEDPGFDDSQWRKMRLPQHWEGAYLRLDGIVWFRKKIQLPPDWKDKALTVSLEYVDNQDITYVNGVKIGSEKAYNIPRIYKIKPELTAGGNLTIAVRVTDTGGPGGIYGRSAKMQIISPEGKSINIAGDWKYKIKSVIGKYLPPKPPIGPGSQALPMSLFNGKINPLIPFGIRGAIWYQGESNARRAYQYRILFPAMIKDWRRHWKQGDFPFLFTQLANFKPVKKNPTESFGQNFAKRRLWL